MEGRDLKSSKRGKGREIPYKILFVGDIEPIRSILSRVLASPRVKPIYQNDPEEAAREAEDLGVNAVLVNAGIKRISALLGTVSRIYPRPYIAVYSTEPSIEEAVRAVKMGASDYFQIPLELLRFREELHKRVQAWIRRARLWGLYGEWYAFNRLIGESPAFKAAVEMARRVSQLDVDVVLIRGETGTGKGLFARVIHHNSPRGDQPFVEIDCTSLSPQLVEAELFGYEPGAFTDAKTRKYGLLEMAGEGTVFLDGVDRLSLAAQAKLVRVLEDRTFRRLGGTREIITQARIIASTTANLESLVRKELFRKDLYFRLSTVTIEVPPLRERGRDILLLADHFIHFYNQQFKRRITGYSKEAEKFLLTYEWPGNVRELRNLLERAVLLTPRPILELDDVKPPENWVLARMARDRLIEILVRADEFSLDEVERKAVEKALWMAKGVKIKAAEILGISRPRLDRLIAKHNLYLLLDHL